MPREVEFVLGTSEMGKNHCVGNIPKEMLETFMNQGNQEIDTAFMYCDGKTEQILGEIDSWKATCRIATKVNPWNGKGLGRESVLSQFSTSLKNLKVETVDILYLHAPDHDTPLEETLAAVQELYKDGKFKEFGLSNYSSWLVSEIVNICKNHHWITPTIYQGMYNAVTRHIEELIPCLRYHGIRLYTYNPLGGGILTGKYKYDQKDNETIPVGRFNGWPWAQAYRERYWKKDHFDIMERFGNILGKNYPNENVGCSEAAYRWLIHHSALEGELGDAIIVGSSRLEQLRTNLSYASKGPLKPEVVTFFEEWWNATRQHSPCYYR